jgi:hypothetical protein
VIRSIPTRQETIEDKGAKRNNRVAVVSASVVALAFSVIHVLSLLQQPGAPGLLPSLIWFFVSLLFGGTAGLALYLILGRIASRWSEQNAVLIGGFSGLLAYAIQVWLLISYAIANPKYIP